MILTQFNCMTQLLATLSSTQAKKTVEEFLRFLDNSPSPYHVVDTTRKLLQKAGYKEWSKESIWNVQPGDKFYITRNQSMLAVFHVGRDTFLRINHSY
jgi:aspartyl aminopeptidase